MAIDTGTLLLGGVILSVSLLLIALMISIGDQYSRFGSALRFALSAGILALVVAYDLPEGFGLSVAGSVVLWVAAVVGTFLLAVAAVVQFVSWLRLGEGDPPLPSPQREPRRDAEDGAERKKA